MDENNITPQDGVECDEASAGDKNDNITVVDNNNGSINIKSEEEATIDNNNDGATATELSPAKLSLYDELIRLDDNNINTNMTQFQCPICLEECTPGEGVLLIDCLHNFCKNCLREYIETATDCEIKCPFIDNTHSCESIIQHCEIKELVDLQTYGKILDRSFVLAELKMKTLFHCKTTNCLGYYDVEGLDSFSCEICNVMNCVKCNAIHQHLTCAEYQRTKNPDLYSQAEIDKILAEKKGMLCPTCGVVIEKIAGCDGVTCTRCKTEICWATKGPRWGPRGKGDTSGGCQCTSSRRCHPSCINCH